MADLLIQPGRGAGTRYQDQYFVLPAWEQLNDCVDELAGMLAAKG